VVLSSGNHFKNQNPVMVQIRKNIGIIAQPRVGKSTLLQKVLEQNYGHTQGAFTREIKQGTERVGFEMRCYENVGPSHFPKAIIAHINNTESLFKVSKYGVDEEAIRTTSLELWKRPILPGKLLYLDEIGQMQVGDDNFRELARKYLGSENTCLVTLSAVYHHSFIDQIKKRGDIILLELTPENRNQMNPFIIGLIKKIEKAKDYVSKPELFFREGDMVELQSDHGKRIINLVGKTCTCDFYNTFKEHHVCSHILAAEAVFQK
jgi:nucleoside-triphosphatase